MFSIYTLVFVAIISVTIGFFIPKSTPPEKPYGRKGSSSINYSFEKERRELQGKRVMFIKKWADSQMKTVPKLCRTTDRKVLVSYEDLLKIWDISDKVWYDL